MAAGDLGQIQSTDVSNGIAVVVANRSLEYLKNNTVMSRLVRRDYDNEIAKEGDTIRITKFTGLTVKSKSGDFEIEKPGQDKVDVKLDQHRYIGFSIDDVAKFLASPDIQKDLMSEGIAKIGEDIDAQLIALYDDVTTNSVGSAGVDATAALLLAARTKLNTSKAPLSERYAVWSPKDEAALISDAKFADSSYSADSGIIKEAALGRKYGIDNFMDQQITVTGTSPLSTHNMVFQRGAFVLATRPLELPPQKTGVEAFYVDEDGVGIRVMVSYNHLKGGYVVTVDILYGVKTLREELACIALA